MAFRVAGGDGTPSAGSAGSHIPVNRSAAPFRAFGQATARAETLVRCAFYILATPIRLLDRERSDRLARGRACGDCAMSWRRLSGDVTLSAMLAAEDVEARDP
jgi:hypothetical protein